MELIIKPTETCNFHCTFCSSTEIADNKSAKLDLKRVFRFLIRFPHTNSIIINGGDPLMMPPSYYWDMIQFIEDHRLPTQLAFTTNLWSFYKKPNLWRDLFRHERVGVTTSFNYGQTRRITPERVFTEEIFIEISDLFLNEIGYRPEFISVITEENLDSAMENVLLAQRLDVECKLNYAFHSGKQKNSLLIGKIYALYLDIIDKGLSLWEYNAKQLLKLKNNIHTTCPLSRNCDEHIRVLQPEGDYYSCGAFGDDRMHSLPFEEEINNPKMLFKPLQNAAQLSYLKEDCLLCPLFKICNGCRKTISDLKKSDRVEAHCFEMKKNLNRLMPYLS